MGHKLDHVLSAIEHRRRRALVGHGSNEHTIRAQGDDGYF